MSTFSTAIFSNALTGIRSNPEAKANQRMMVNASKIKNVSKGSAGNEMGGRRTDIFERLRQTGNKKPARLLHDKVKRDEYREHDVGGLHRKTISKDITSRLGRRNQNQNQNSDAEESKGDDGLWKHDKYHDGPLTAEDTAACTIFIRNLPDQTGSDSLKRLLKQASNIVGHTIERGTAEVIFSSRSAATRAVEDVHGKLYMGNTLKAALVSELNQGMIKGRKTSGDLRDENDHSASGGRRNTEFKSRMTIDSARPSTGKGASILDRIKKRR